MKRLSPKLTAALLLGAVFGAGLLGGSALDGAFAAGPDGAAARCADRKGGGYERILGELALEGEQRARIDAILERRRGEIRAFWEGDGARLRAIVDSTRAEIRAVMTPEQRARYDSLKAEHRKRHSKARARAPAAGTDQQGIR